MGPTPRNGLSLPSSGCSVRNHLCRIIVSGLLLQDLAASVSGPFHPWLPTPVCLADPRWLIASGPLPVPLPGNPSGSSRLCSPSGPLNPFGSPLGPIHRREAHPRRTPDLLSLPAGGSFDTTSCGSSFQVRLVLRGSLFREPLGTFSILQRKLLSVKRNLRRRGLFPQKISVLFSKRC
jgi:hypothetical protein